MATSDALRHIQENFAVSAFPVDAVREIRAGIATNVRSNAAVGTGVPGFILQVS